MKDIFIIINGETRPQYGGYRDVWASPLNIRHYYKTEQEAELLLFEHGYEKDSDGIYFSIESEEHSQSIAKIVRLTNGF